MEGFVYADGKKLFDAAGREILLRGVGLGGWLLPEGYMWCFPEQIDRPNRIEHRVEELLGPRDARSFWEQYYKNYIAEEDIQYIANEGFNSVRLPINSRHLLNSDGTMNLNGDYITHIDMLIEWCRNAGIYVILDMHAAPGGQTGTNIDDSQDNSPALFTNSENIQKLIELWRALAKRYCDEATVAGYDLLNEPLPAWFSQYDDEVMPLYRKLIAAIRCVDQNHMLILEGVHWATDWSIFKEKPDDNNFLLQFHKYWNNPDEESLSPYLKKRDEWDVPIFMGEGGENNRDWYAGVFHLLDDFEISWNFWTWKKLDTTNSPCSIKKPVGWDKLVNHLQGTQILSRVEAKKILWQYLDNLPIGRCNYFKEVTNAIFRRPPVRIPAAFYDYTGKGKGYLAAFQGKKAVEFRKNDQTDIRLVIPNGGKVNFEHGKGEQWTDKDWIYVRLRQGDWLSYSFEYRGNDDSPINIIVNARSADKTDSRISVVLDDNTIGFIEVSNNSFAEYAMVHKKKVMKGKHSVKLYLTEGTSDIKSISLNLRRH